MVQVQKENFFKRIELLFKDYLPDIFKINSGVIRTDFHPTNRETEIIKNMNEKRQAEYVSGRHYARQLLQEYFPRKIDIPTGYFHEPIWPENFIGSISHDGGIVVVVLAKLTKSNFNIGIDILYLENQYHKIEKTIILSETEEGYIDEYSRKINIDKKVLAFSLKESVIKCVSPLIKDFVNLEEILLKEKLDRLIAIYQNYEFKLSYFKLKNYLFTIATIL